MSVQVVPDNAYKAEEVWFTFDDDAQQTRYPLRYSGAGTYSTANTSLTARFAISTTIRAIRTTVR